MFKIAFLFLVTNNIYHEDYWRDFWGAHAQQYSVYVHSKQQANLGRFFEKYRIAQNVPTTWLNTMQAQIALLKAALEDSDNQKFVFVSESTLPLQSFEYVYHVLMRTQNSIFHHWFTVEGDPDRPIFALKNGLKSNELRYKNWQWIVLNRKHAELMVQDQEILPQVVCYPCDNEIYPTTFLGLKNLLHEVCDQDTCYVNWHRRNGVAAPRALPYIFKNLYDLTELSCIVKAINQKYLFARKFTEFLELAPLDKYLSYRRV